MTYKSHQKVECLKKYNTKYHFIEFRNRLLISVVAFFICTLVGYFYSEEIYAFLTKPLLEVSYGSRRLIYTHLTEAFFTYLKISCYAGLIFSFPVIISQVYFFIAPGLYRNERKTIISIFILSPILFMLGAAIVYYFVMPIAWQFFLSFENTGSTQHIPIVLEARVSDYLDLTLEMIVGFGLAFQLPIIAFVLARVGVLKRKWLIHKRKYAIVLIFIAAAMLTPPDVVSQILLAIPMLLLYEISILICKLTEKKGK